MNDIEIEVLDYNNLPDYVEHEEQRQANEAIRIENESTRVENENTRIENENARILSEEEREEYITDLKQKVLDGDFNGEDGQDGFSPTITAAKEDKTTTITITDINGTTTTTLLDGNDGNVQDVKINGTSIVTSHVANITGLESTSNKVTSISESSTNTQYPSAKCLYDSQQAQNNQISTLNSQVAGLASGSPLVASSTAGMTDTSRVYVNTSDGHWYYYNGSSWADGGVYQATGVGLNEVGYNELKANVQNDIYTKQSNLDDIYDEGYKFSNKYYITSQGTVSANSSYTYEGCIRTPLYIEEGSTIATNSNVNLFVGEYSGKPDGTAQDFRDKFIRRVDLTGGNKTYTCTNSCYIIVDVALINTSGTASVDTLENLTFNIVKSTNTIQDKKTDEINNNKLKDLYYYCSNINQLYNNQYNYSQNSYINTQGGVSVGESYTNEGTILTPLYVEAGSTITANDKVKLVVGEYSGKPDGTNQDYLDKFIQRVKFNTGNGVYTATSGCYILIDLEYIDTTKQATVDILKNITFNVRLNKLSTLNNDISDYYRYIKKCFANGYYKGLNDNYGSKTFNSSTTYDYVITAFDELMASDTNYISKNTLGIGSGTNSQQQNYNIYEYVLTPASIDLSRYSARNNPKILIIQAQQGFEKSDVYGMYYFIYDLINNYEKNPILSYIRENVEIHLIPIVCPWAWDNNLYYNANGVSLNRNYYLPWWEETSPSDPNEYTGTEPFSEPETQIVRDFIANNKDAILFIDNHTNGRYSVNSYENINWIEAINTGDTYTNEIINVVSIHMNEITAQFKKEYNLPLGNSICGMFTYPKISTNLKGSADIYSTMYGKMVGLTFEGFNGFPNETTFTGDVFKANSELIGNFIINFLKVFSNI